MVGKDKIYKDTITKIIIAVYADFLSGHCICRIESVGDYYKCD